ncbi:MAG: hypothetical protein AAGG53_13490 [Cyanobacteria bacterium P01_H01_bin.152]
MPSSYLTDLSNLAAIDFSRPVVIFLTVLHCAIGLTAAQVAHRKGANRGFWLIWGLIGGTIALITALRLPTSVEE